MRCWLCNAELHYVHGHGFCARPDCPLRGMNLEPCCQGECAQASSVPPNESANLRRMRRYSRP